jgi:multidrug efflux pump subunit AcrA (membrane-fusion protein)
MVSQRRLVVASVLALGGAALAASALLPASNAAAPDAAAAPIPVQAERVASLAGGEGPSAPDSAFAATIRHDREAQLAFRVPGRIVAFPVHVGDRLPRGALVAMIEANAFRAAAVRADADRDRTALASAA